MKRPKIIVIFVFLFLIAARILFNNSQHLTIIVAMINVIALLAVVIDIGENLKKNIVAKIKKECASKGIANREIAIFQRKFYPALIALCILLTGLHLIFCVSNLGNDIIPIVSLGLSILEDELIHLLTYVYKV